MIANKFFNDSSNTNTGKPKFMPPQKRQLLEYHPESPKDPEPIVKNSPQEKVNINNSPNIPTTEDRKPGFFSFKRNCKSFLSPWGLRHTRNGYLEKNVEEEEKKLFNDQRNLSEPQADNVGHYDKLEVDLINKTQLEVPKISEKFEHLNLSPHLLDNIQRLGYQKLTIIQRYGIAIIRENINLMACSQTGSGKTASFLIPIIQDLLQTGVPSRDVSPEEFKKNKRAYPIAVILAPTRELALQIYNESRKFCYMTGILAKAIYGGKDPYEQHRDLINDGCDILIATPGRLIDFMDRFVSFNHLKFIVLDEADKMLDMGFEPQIRDIIDRCMQESLHKENIHMSMFSATFPKQVKNLAEEYLKKYIYIGIGNEGKSGSINSCITQELIDVRSLNKNLLLFELISKLEGKLLIFCATKRAVSNIYNYLNSKNLFVSQIHGDLNQKEREGELHLFKNKCSIMIATDVASRGLDIPDVTCVINYDLPTNIESYIHRIGRTGRIGKVGRAISFIDTTDEPMFYKLYVVLQESKNEIPQWFQTLAVQQKDRTSIHNRSKKSHAYNRRNHIRYNKEDNGFDQEYTKPNGDNVHQYQRSLENQENRGGYNENIHIDE